MFDLAGKVALVTGASSGIGKAAAIHLHKCGAKVGMLARKLEKLQEANEALGGAGHVIAADVSSDEEMKSACDEVACVLGGIDIVFANAGINGVWAPLDEIELHEWKNTLDVNLTGTFLTIKHSLPYLKRNGGSVIVTSSVNGTRMFSNTGATAYGASKAAQVAMAKMLALELAQWKIRVNVICPGYIETEIGSSTTQRNLEKVRYPVHFPEGQVPLTPCEGGSAEDVAKLVAFLASDAAGHISGTEVWIDGAQSLLVG